MIAVQQLSTTVSTCTPLVQTLERADFGITDEATPLDGLEVGLSEDGEVCVSTLAYACPRISTMANMQAVDTALAQPLINASMVVCIALLAKNHLLGCYGLSEECV